MRKVAGWIVACVLLQGSVFAQSSSEIFPSVPVFPSLTAVGPMADGKSDGQSAAAGLTTPILADNTINDSSVYAQPVQAGADQGVNEGGGHLDLDFKYVNRYVYRGVDHDPVSKGNNLNLLIEGRLSFDFGAYPHPFVGLFSNIEDADPVSRFQEFRPQLGLTWNLRPFLLEGGATNYIYPQRESFNTQEVYIQTTIDDSFIFGTREPILSPYLLSAYDYHLNDGWYLEAGIKHDFKFEQIGLTITPQASIAYINAIKTQFDIVNPVNGTGFQHAEGGMEVTYSINRLLHQGKRYGEFDVRGYLFYDDKLDRTLTASYTIWGGAGIGFKY